LGVDTSYNGIYLLGDTVSRNTMIALREDQYGWSQPVTPTR